MLDAGMDQRRVIRYAHRTATRPVHQNLPFAKGNRPEGEERGLQSPGLGGKSHLIDHLHPAGRRVAMKSDGALQAGEFLDRDSVGLISFLDLAEDDEKRLPVQ